MELQHVDVKLGGDGGLFRVPQAVEWLEFAVLRNTLLLKCVAKSECGQRDSLPELVVTTDIATFEDASV